MHIADLPQISDHFLEGDALIGIVEPVLDFAFLHILDDVLSQIFLLELEITLKFACDHFCPSLVMLRNHLLGEVVHHVLEACGLSPRIDCWNLRISFRLLQLLHEEDEAIFDSVPLV